MGTKHSTKTSQTKQKTTHFWNQHRRLAKWLLGIAISVVVVVGAVYVAFQVSPWPGSLLIRYEFDQNSAKVSKALEKHVPDTVASVENQQYRLNDSDGFLDVFYPKAVQGNLPTVVWVHGGGWVSGDKNNIDNYLKILASYGFTTVGVDYTVAPEATYPKPMLQVNEALDYLQQHADRLHIDANRIVMAGDSAGSQIVAQMATIITSQAYAEDIHISPTLAAQKLKGMVLFCGAYDLSLPDYNGPFGNFLHTVLWAYSGKKDFLNDPSLRHASVVNYVTKDFPPSFISAGNADPLENQSEELAQKLQKLGVRTDTLFYPAQYRGNLPHEYQFNLDTDDGQKALEQLTRFLKTL